MHQNNPEQKLIQKDEDMHELDHIIRYTESLKPDIIRNIDYNRITKNLKQCQDTNVYVLLPNKYENLDFYNKQNNVSGNDNTLLFLIILVKHLTDSNITPRIILDSVEDINKLQEIARAVQFVEKDEYGNTSTYPMSDIRFVRNNELGHKTYFNIYKGRRIAYSPYAKEILVSTNSEDISSENIFDMLIYLKRNEQFYKSGFPRFVSPEYKINQTKNNRCPLVVIITNTLSIPRHLLGLNAICVPVKQYIKRKIIFEPVMWEGYFSFKSVNDKILNLLNDFEAGIGKLYLCAGILFVLHGDSTAYNDQINESLVIRMTDNLTFRVRVKDLFQELTDYKKELGKLNPAISSWADILSLRREMEKDPVKVQFVKPLEKSMMAVYEYLFSDIITLNKLFAYLEGISDDDVDFEVLKTRTYEIIKKETPQEVEIEKMVTDFDPEVPVGYITSEYKTSEKGGPVAAHYFILASGGAKYIFYCQIGKNSKVKISGSSQKRSLDQLKEGDVIEKRYWNYTLLRAKILDAIDKGEIGNSESLLKYIEESDSFRHLLEKYALSESNYELDKRYSDLVDYSVKNFLRRWSIETMRPSKVDLFIAVTQDINKTYNCNFEPLQLLQKLQKIKNLKKAVSTYEDKEDTISYKIVEGPVKITIEVEKLGRIYRLS